MENLKENRSESGFKFYNFLVAMCCNLIMNFTLILDRKYLKKHKRNHKKVIFHKGSFKLHKPQDCEEQKYEF